MRTAISVILGGVGAIIAGWVLPMLNDDLPQLLQWALLGFGCVLLVVGAGLGVTESKTIFPEHGSTTARAKGRAKITLEDSFSTADTLIDAQEDAEIAARRIHHHPTRPSGRAKPDDQSSD